MRSFILFLFAVLLVGCAAPAFAGVDSSDRPSIAGKGVPAETGVNIVAAKSFVGIPVFFEADDTSAYAGPTQAAALDQGNEACAVYGLSCAVVYLFTPNGANDMSIVTNGCTDDAAIADDALAFAICF
jgi:hypothetical protein